MRVRKTDMATKCARLLLVLVTLAALSHAAHAQGEGDNRNPDVLPPHAKYRGMTYGEWKDRYQK